MLTTALYISTITGKARYLLAGPYRTQWEADRRLPELTDVEIAECPAEFIERLDYNYPTRLTVVHLKATRSEFPASWFGNSIEKIDVERLF